VSDGYYLDVFRSTTSPRPSPPFYKWRRGGQGVLDGGWFSVGGCHGNRLVRRSAAAEQGRIVLELGRVVCGSMGDGIGNFKGDGARNRCLL